MIITVIMSASSLRGFILIVIALSLHREISDLKSRRTIAENSLARNLDWREKIILLQMAIKIADVGHMMAPFEIHLKWSKLLEEEFFAQGDMEKHFGMTPSPLMDRKKPGVTSGDNQRAFLNVFVKPMVDAWVEICPVGGKRLLHQVCINARKWGDMTLSAIEVV